MPTQDVCELLPVLFEEAGELLSLRTGDRWN